MKVVVTGGGTGGHIFPALIVAQRLQALGHDVYYIGNRYGMEQRIVQPTSVPFYGVESAGFSKKDWFSFLIKNSNGTWEAMKILKHLRPDYIFATGGYVSAPVLGAANLLRIPYGVHEQNIVMGKVNQLTSKGAKHIFHSFPVIETKYIRHTGNPVRYTEPLEQLGDSVVFLGGSGGSETINQAAMYFAQSHPFTPVILITGKKRFERIQKEKKTPNVVVYDFVEDMLDIYKKARLVVCRSGSGTLFELANLGIPSILVPYPDAANHHQEKNAEWFVRKNAAWMIKEKEEKFFQTLASSIDTLYHDTNAQQQMRESLKHIAVRDSLDRICEIITKK